MEENISIFINDIYILKCESCILHSKKTCLWLSAKMRVVVWSTVLVLSVFQFQASLLLKGSEESYSGGKSKGAVGSSSSWRIALIWCSCVKPAREVQTGFGENWALKIQSKHVKKPCWKAQMLWEFNLDVDAVVYIRVFHFKLCPGAINSAVRTCFKLQFLMQYSKMENHQKLFHLLLRSRNLRKAAEIGKSIKVWLNLCRIRH